MNNPVALERPCPSKGDRHLQADIDLLAEFYIRNGVGRESRARATALIRQTGNIGAALSCPTARLRHLGITDLELRILGLLRSTLSLALRRPADERPHLPNLSSVIDYLHVEMAYNRREVFRVLFLNGHLRLLHDEVVGIGSVASVEVHPRVIISRALEVNASNILLVHNHPSGNPTPSRADIQITARTRDAGRVFDINVIDHIIVARTGHTSLRAEKLM